MKYLKSTSILLLGIVIGFFACMYLLERKLNEWGNLNAKLDTKIAQIKEYQARDELFEKMVGNIEGNQLLELLKNLEENDVPRTTAL